jgi:hypothetical protein
MPNLPEGKVFSREVNTRVERRPSEGEIQGMKTKTNLVKSGKAGIVLALLTVGTMAAPMSYADDLHIGVNIGAPTVTVAPDNYVYYPAYGAYYSPRRHLFAYEHAGSWVWEAAPPGVSANVVLATPSVKMDFHDAPWLHHKEIVRRYPHDWRGDHGEHLDRDREHDRDHDRR